MMSLVEGYLALRRAAGFKLEATEWRLRSFARFAAERGETLIRATTAMDWAVSASSPRQRHVRLRDVALLARHLSAEGSSHELPDRHAFPRDRQDEHRLPYIYRNDDIARILAAASDLKPIGSSRADSHRTLYGLLAATGLRIGEALRLDVKDVSSDALLIRNTKFRKSRLVPLHATVVTELEAYRKRWRRDAGPDAPFFRSQSGDRLGSAGVFDTFDQIVRGLGLRTSVPPGENHRPRPRLHDFRHTFAVRSLEACPKGRAAIDRHMLALSTYLGHASVTSTYWYIHATPALLTDIADACDAWLLGGGQ